MRRREATTGRDAGAGSPSKLKEAMAAHQGGELERAESLYREFIRTNPDNPTALQLYGVLLSQQKDYPAAIQLMQKSLILYPEQAEVANNLGNALKRYGRIDDAIDSYARAIELYPKYVEALRNKALCHTSKQQFGEARNCLQRALDAKPDDPVCWLMLGNIHQQQGDHDAAISCYEKALQLKPDYADAHHNLGLSLRMKIEPRDALKHYRTAQELGLDRAELHHNIGNALIDELDADGAIIAYRDAVSRNPLDFDSHRHLNTLLWQQNKDDEYLESYRSAITQFPDIPQLRIAYAIALNQKGDFSAAERILQEGLARGDETSAIRSLLAMSLEGLQEWDKALEEHARTANVPDSMPDHRINYARALLVRQRPDEALEQAKLGAMQMPFNQRALAYLGLCWRVLGDERDSVLNDYDHMVQMYEVPIPDQYANTGEFNARLAKALDHLHIGKRHPPEQTLRGGSQTYGDLFVRKEEEILQLVNGIQRCVEDYIGRMPQHSDHPLMTRRTNRYDFAASWSVRLASCGYHEMHVHPLGWISSAYYVQVPAEIANNQNNDGGIKFGEPDIDLGDHGKARRIIKPAVGRLVLFPSYMWHGTIPFESGDPRMTVAFDVVPVKQPGKSA